jgi:hypothetical protein
VISDVSSAQDRGTAFALYNLVLGMAAIPAGLLCGGMWHYRCAAAALLLAALIAAGAVIPLHLWAWRSRAASST